jgi:hypothetical protein
MESSHLGMLRRYHRLPDHMILGTRVGAAHEMSRTPGASGQRETIQLVRSHYPS